MRNRPGRIVTAAAAAALIATSAAALGDEVDHGGQSLFYAGMHFGKAQLGNGAKATGNEADSDLDRLGAIGAFVGWNLSSWFAIETGVRDLGKYEANEDPEDDNAAGVSMDRVHSLRAGVQVLFPRYRIQPHLDLGLHHWRTKRSADNCDPSDLADLCKSWDVKTGEPERDNGTDLYYGAGVRWWVDRHESFAVGADWKRMKITPGKMDTHVTVVDLSLIYRF